MTRSILYHGRNEAVDGDTIILDSGKYNKNPGEVWHLWATDSLEYASRYVLKEAPYLLSGEVGFINFIPKFKRNGDYVIDTGDTLIEDDRHVLIFPDKDFEMGFVYALNKKGSKRQGKIEEFDCYEYTYENAQKWLYEHKITPKFLVENKLSKMWLRLPKRGYTIQDVTEKLTDLAIIAGCIRKNNADYANAARNFFKQMNMMTVPVK